MGASVPSRKALQIFRLFTKNKDNVQVSAFLQGKTRRIPHSAIISCLKPRDVIKLDDD